jgi:GNAT superfamily N-acetyltransferase
MLEKLEKGQKCFGMKHRGDIVAFMWFVFDEFILKPGDPKLNEYEVYLSDMYTMREFRGRGVAPYLRYQSYKVLKEMDKTSFYSVTDFFNKSAIHFKQKLNAKYLSLNFCCEFFRKFHWQFTIRKY